MILISKEQRIDYSDDQNIIYRTIDFIRIDSLREFAVAALNEYGTPEQLEEANKVADVVRDILTKKKLLDESTHQSFVDIMLCAALLHNLFYEENNWTTLFTARYILEQKANEMGIPSQALDPLFHTIEGQLGEDMPVKECIPKPGTPSEVFSYAVWFVKNYSCKECECNK